MVTTRREVPQPSTERTRTRPRKKNEASPGQTTMNLPTEEQLENFRGPLEED
jgi:hypothetical protein